MCRERTRELPYSKVRLFFELRNFILFSSVLRLLSDGNIAQLYYMIQFESRLKQFVPFEIREVDPSLAAPSASLERAWINESDAPATCVVPIVSLLSVVLLAQRLTLIPSQSRNVESSVPLPPLQRSTSLPSSTPSLPALVPLSLNICHSLFCFL